MIAIGLTAQIQTHRPAAFVLEDVCACAGSVLYIQLSMCQSIFLLYLLHTVHLYAFYLPIHIYPRQCGDIWLAKPKPGSLSTFPLSCHV